MATIISLQLEYEGDDLNYIVPNVLTTIKYSEPTAKIKSLQSYTVKTFDDGVLVSEAPI